ncbi:class GN sortase [Dokdonella immobilis]|uniref:Sortase A n=1 Tax=Dokdonella immobilis TaxID=578942 RepID=A0A1I4X956_9GAMM|nr:class GN sortase [Dokdonella immobilis]SFN22437.1 sortase A [Dokdonella immobilis]
MAQPSRRLALLLALCACMPLGHASYMQAKAGLAQVLLRQAWQRHLESGDAARPWPWADMSPVARLRVARLGVDEIVLSGDSGRTLAFGPGWAESSAPPASSGLSVISAHRDTHFAFLRQLSVGDAITLDAMHEAEDYRVASIRIVDARHERIETATAADALLLVTCYPFDALDPGGPLRYVVTAVPGRSAQPAVTQAQAFGASSLSSSSIGGAWSGPPDMPGPPRMPG